MKEYKSTETSIQSAKVDTHKSLSGSKDMPDYILFDGEKVQTGLWIDVPENFRVRLEFLSKPDIDQGADINVKDGFLILQDGEEIELLRTWHDPKFESFVEYSGYSKSGRVLVNNVYKVNRSGQEFEERWTGNAGMLVEALENNEFILKCSSCHYNPPNFESIVFKVSIVNNGS